MFDTYRHGSLERAARVLNLAGYTEYLEETGMYSVFICEPVDFNDLSTGSKAYAVPLEIVTETIIHFADGGMNSSDEVQFLAEKLKRGSD